MTKWIIRTALLCGLVLAGIWCWHKLFPGPEQIIRNRLAALAKTASSKPDESFIAKASRVESLSGYFTPDVEITIDLPGEFSQSIHGTGELMQMAAAARSMGRTIKVDILDVTVDVSPDKESAEAHMTGQAKIGGERALQVQELKAHFRKVKSDWLIDRVETVRTLR